jgi:hypothetical protein
MTRRDVRSFAAVPLLIAIMWLHNTDAFGDSFTIKIDGVRYTLPSSDSFRPNTEPSNPYKYTYEYMFLVIENKKLFIAGECYYKARRGDHVTVPYVPNYLVVNGKKIPEYGSEPSRRVDCG